MNEPLFLGHTLAYWSELEARARTLKADGMLQEIVDLKGKLEFTKSRLEEINKILNI